MNEIIKYRREFHQFPEPGWKEIRTSARVASILSSIGVDVIIMGEKVVNLSTLRPPVDISRQARKANMERAIAEGADPDIVKKTGGIPGVIGYIDTGKPGPTWAFRFDMDCLPYSEFSGNGYRPFEEGYISQNEGCVHACGHDGHTAIGLGLAGELVKNRGRYKGKIKLIFQPAEETLLGAESIVDKGHLDDVDRFIAVHLALSAENTPLPSHTLGCGCKDFLSNRQIDATFHGRAAHPCGAAQEGRNALLAACSAALNLHAIAPHEKGLCRVNVGMIRGGDCTNTITPECTLGFEYRGRYREICDYLEKRVFEVLDGSAKAYGLDYTYVDYGETPAAQSDDEMMKLVQKAAGQVPWFKKVYYEANLGGSDDAAAMINRVQEHGGIGAYVGIGTDTTQPLHNPEFDFDEECLEAAVELLAAVLRE